MLMEILNLAMLLVPPLFALIIHNYLRHGEVSGKRMLILFPVYFIIMNGCVFIFSWLRGVRGLHFAEMTFSYKLKYIGLGSTLGFVVPFIVCLVTEDQITIGGFRRYILRFIRDMRRYFPYAARAARADLRSEVTNSYLDWLWWIIEPFCTMLIYTLIFGVVFKAAEPHFPIFIFIGITMWIFFSRNISSSVNMVRDNREIVTKIYMPKYILLLSKMFANVFKMLTSFGIVVVMMLFSRVSLTWNVLYVFPVLLILFLFTFGAGTIMMHYGVYVTDLAYITGIVLNMMVYFTGTFYSISNRVPAPFGEILEVCNPIAFLIASMRNALLYGMTPPWEILCVWGVISVILAALGVFTVYSNENSYVKMI